MRIKAIKDMPCDWERIEFATFPKGTIVQMEAKEDSEFKSWHPAVIDGHKTFVPISFVDNSGRLNRAYNPTELSVKAGDILELIEIVNAWLVVKNARGAVGWIPAEAVVSEGGAK